MHRKIYSLIGHLMCNEETHPNLETICAFIANNVVSNLSNTSSSHCSSNLEEKYLFPSYLHMDLVAYNQSIIINTKRSKVGNVSLVLGLCAPFQ